MSSLDGISAEKCEIVTNNAKNEEDNSSSKLVEAVYNNPHEKEKKNITKKARVTKFIKKIKKVKRVKDFITNKHRAVMATRIKESALAYRQSFDALARECDFNLNIAGSFAQLQNALNRIKDGLTTEDLMPEAVETAIHLLDLEAAKRAMEADGVPVLITMQISRSVTDADIPNCHEIVVVCDSDDDDDNEN